jgi:maltose alpha-D-glucosyltransferase / alpha-amylase
MSEGSAVLEIASFEELTEVSPAHRFGPLLPSYITGRRWFRAKARTVREIGVEDIIAVPETEAHLFLLRVHYAEGDSDLYLLPLWSSEQESAGQEELLAGFRTVQGRTGVIYSALSEAPFRDALLDAVVCERTLKGRNGELAASRTSALDRSCAPATPKLSNSVSRAEQSNTSIIYGDQYILKLFRKLESGINPDVEVGRFLTEQGFQNTPAVLGSFEYRAGNGATGGTYAAGILLDFVRNKGDAWKYTLDSLAEFFSAALAPSAPNLPPFEAVHPLEAMESEARADIRTLTGAYLSSAALLGKRTAQMHAALASSHANPDFTPEPFRPEDGEALLNDMTSQADITFRLLREKIGGLRGDSEAAARALLDREEEVRSRFSALRDFPVSTVRIRFHGDYHLGQVLYTGQDFMIIDFEGEPARPLAERRTKTIALRDVAGMVRSFQYAAYAALFGQASGVSSGSDERSQLELAAEHWNSAAVASYLKGYFDESGHLAFVPSSTDERRLFLDAFLLQKALYEVAYELNNRPDWVLIPLRGILNLLS